MNYYDIKNMLRNMLRFIIMFEMLIFKVNAIENLNIETLKKTSR